MYYLGTKLKHTSMVGDIAAIFPRIHVNELGHGEPTECWVHSELNQGVGNFRDPPPAI